MLDLKDTQEIKKLDPKNVLGSTEMLASQCEQIWQDAKSVPFPKAYKKVSNIVICGMGGSAYGGHVALSGFRNELRVPLVVQNNYYLPAFTNENTLVILTSYSGSTEETLSCARDALARRAKITGITSGGKLGEFLTLQNLPSLIFNAQHNPSSQPRLGTGYIVLGTIALLRGLGFVSLSDSTVSNAIAELKDAQENIKSKARSLAKKLHGFLPVIFAAEFLEGNAHIMRNQFNETSKSFAAFSEIPELNHHLMEGLKNPADKKMGVLLLNSSLYPPIIQKRLKLTKDVVQKNSVAVAEYTPFGSTKVSQILNTLSFGGYLTLYLAFLYGQDPSVIPWVDYFKKKLA